MIVGISIQFIHDVAVQLSHVTCSVSNAFQNAIAKAV